jgi:hypothetical protein
MPFCPSCRCEYLEGITECPDCQVALVERLPEPPPATPARSEADLEQVELCVILGEIHAQLLQDRLREEGLPSRLQAAGLFTDAVFANAIYPSNVIGGQLAAARVMVNRGDLDRAKQVYGDFELTKPEQSALKE